jgi:hypothetical protein
MNPDRRKLIAQGVSLSIAMGAGPMRAFAADPCRPTGFQIDGQPVGPTSANCVVQTGSLLSASDVKYLGYFEAETDGKNSTYYQGMHLRRVNGEAKLLLAHYSGSVVQVSVGRASYGSRLTAIENTWELARYLEGYHRCIWWDEDGQRLWILNTDGYTIDNNPCRLYTVSLGSNGSVSGARGPIGLSGVSGKRTRSGAIKIPASVQAATGVGPYALGLGAYTSLMAQGGACAMGLSLYAIPDPASISGLIASSRYRALAERSDSPRGTRIWYGYDFSRQSGKGPVNYFDGGDGRQNPTSRPTERPLSSAQWQSPNASGRAHWIWGDRYVGGTWLDGGSRSGVLMVGDFGTGYGWYQQSSLAYDGRCCELHVFDPQHLADVANGKRAGSSVEPVNMIALPEADSGGDGGYGRGCYAAFDDVDKKLYVLKCSMNGEYTARIYVYSINS